MEAIVGSGARWDRFPKNRLSKSRRGKGGGRIGAAGTGAPTVVKREEKFGLLPEYWQPCVVAELNDYQFKIGA